jgi:pyrimidine deaminase RibD-like protein
MPKQKPPSERVYKACKISVKKLDELDDIEDVKKGEHPYVSAIILDRNGDILKDKNGKELIELTDPKTKKHAEAKVIERMISSGDDVISRAHTLITTLEPCSYRNTTKHPEEIACAKLISYAGIRHVVIGMLDPSLTVRGRGLAFLEHCQGFYFTMFPEELVEKVRDKNKEYIKNIEDQIMYRENYESTISPRAEYQLEYAPKSIRNFMDEGEVRNLIEEINEQFHDNYHNYNNREKLNNVKLLKKYPKDLEKFAVKELHSENSPSNTLIKMMKKKKIDDHTIFEKMLQYIGIPNWNYEIQKSRDYELDKKVSILLTIYAWTFP